MPRPGRLRAIALLAATFVAGALAGGALVATAERDRVPGGKGSWRHDRSEAYVRRLERELDLTAAQRDSVRAAIERRGRAMEAVWREVEPRFEALRDSIRADIRSHLTPDQVRRYDELLRRLDAERQRMRKRHDPD